MPVLLSDLALEMLTIIVEVSTLQSFLKQETVFQIFDIRYFHVVFKLFKSLVGSGIIFIEKNGRWHHRSDLDRNALEYFVSSNSETIFSYFSVKKSVIYHEYLVFRSWTMNLLRFTCWSIYKTIDWNFTSRVAISNTHMKSKRFWSNREIAETSFYHQLPITWLFIITSRKLMLKISFKNHPNFLAYEQVFWQDLRQR